MAKGLADFSKILHVSNLVAIIDKENKKQNEKHIGQNQRGVLDPDGR